MVRSADPICCGVKRLQIRGRACCEIAKDLMVTKCQMTISRITEWRA